MDLTIDVEDYKLNIRSSEIIIHNNKILVHKNVNSAHYAIIGGRVEIGESSKLIIKQIFEGKEEKMYTLKKDEKEKIKEIKREYDSYEKLLKTIDDACDSKNTKEKIKNSLESYIDGVNVVNAYENEKFYIYGFVDGVKLMIECFGE